MGAINPTDAEIVDESAERIAALEEALRIIKKLCAGDRAPNWADSMAIVHTRTRILDICEIADKQ